MINYGYGISLTPDIPEQARQWRNDPQIYKWCRQVEPLPKWTHEDWLQRIRNDRSIRMYGVRMRDIDVGVCGFTSINHINRTAEFSLYISSECQGYGYGSAALQTLVEHGFKNLNLNRIWGETFAGNPALKMFQSIGFIIEGKLRQSYYKDGKYFDSLIVGILREDWKTKK